MSRTATILATFALGVAVAVTSGLVLDRLRSGDGATQG